MGPAPGTVASLAAVLVAWPIQIYGGAYALLAATIAVFAIGWWAVANYQQQVGVIDAPEIVVDEVAGMWLTLSFAPPQIIYFVVGFALFRLFDISKPWPVSWADRQLKGGLGVMMDDVLAGLYAIFCLWVIAWIVHQAGLA
tara:strand:+ start:256 stop:678 length:423 start_codon:yes stop_codon:yes gene_type:complete